MFWHLLLILLSAPPAGTDRSFVTTGPSAATAGQADRESIPEAEQLVLRLARENPYWGYTKLAVRSSAA